jgi:hypothetical protein
MPFRHVQAPWVSLKHSLPIALHDVQTLLMHNAPMQSSRPSQRLPFAQRAQEPPQSMSLSVPFLIPSLQVGAGSCGRGATAMQRPPWHIPPAQPVPSGSVALHLPFLRFLQGGHGFFFLAASPGAPLPSPSPAPTSPRKTSRREGMRLTMRVITPKRVWSTLLLLAVGTRHLGRSDLLCTTALFVPASAGVGILFGVAE